MIVKAVLLRKTGSKDDEEATTTASAAATAAAALQSRLENFKNRGTSSQAGEMMENQELENSAFQFDELRKLSLSFDR